MVRKIQVGTQNDERYAQPHPEKFAGVAQSRKGRMSRICNHHSKLCDQYCGMQTHDTYT